MIVSALLCLILRLSRIVLVAYMPKLPALQATPLLAAAVVTNFEAYSVGGGVTVFYELLHFALSSLRRLVRVIARYRT
jgi:hypothetical protein